MSDFRGRVVRRGRTDRLRNAGARIGRALLRFVPDADGAVLVEYALVLSLLSVVMIGGMKAIELATATALTNVQTEMLHYGLRDGL